MAKILIVDDDPACVSLLERMLTKLGYETASVTDGLKAAQVAAEEKPDLILLDFIIPAADGRVLLDRLRGAADTARTPVIVITGAPLVDVMARLPDRGLRFIDKPIDQNLLVRLITEALGPLSAPPPEPPPLGPPPGSPPPPPSGLQLSDDDTTTSSGDTLDLDT